MTAFPDRASHPLTLAWAGIGVIAMSFGMARYGFGLLAPDIRASFGLSSGALGLLEASYLAYLVATVTAGVSAISSGTGWGVALAAPARYWPAPTGAWPGCGSR